MLTMKMKPQIAIVIPNTLAALGMADLLHRMMPGAETTLFNHAEDLMKHTDAESFFHYFVSAQEVISSPTFFLGHQHKTIVLVHGEESGLLPKGFHMLNVYQSESALVRDIMQMAHHSHHQHGQQPEAVRQAEADQDTGHKGPLLTPREREVLSGIVRGMLNKEIAAELGVSLATIITHRKNLTEKLGTKSVAALTIFAVAHGIVRSEEI